MSNKDSQGRPSGASLRNLGAIPFASQIPNDSAAPGNTVKDALGNFQAAGPLSYQGVWDANANNPALASGAGTKGYYYAVSTAGATDLDGVTPWVEGDLAVYNGTAWEKVNSNVVASVHGRTGAVIAVVDDYQASLITNDSGVAGVNVDDALDTLDTDIATVSAIVEGRRKIKVEDLAIDALNDEQTVAIGGSAGSEFCPITAIFHLKAVGAVGATGNTEITIGILAGGTEVLAATTLTGLSVLNDKFIVDLSAIVKAAIAADGDIFVKVTSADTTADAGHLVDVHIIGETFTSGV